MAVMTCPGEGRLRDLIAGQLATTETLAVEDHIEQCPGCQKQTRTGRRVCRCPAT